MNGKPLRYVPALRFHALTRFYDRVLASTLKEDKFRTLLIEQAGLAAGQRILDLGCGTATLTILLKRASPEATVVGLDADPAALEIARRKAASEGVEIAFHRCLAWDAPFESASFDRVLSSLVLHHLTTEGKRRTFRKIRDLLGPGGELHVADWGRAHDFVMRLAFLPVQLLDGFETTSDNVKGKLLPLMRENGFRGAVETRRERTALGTLSLYRAPVESATPPRAPASGRRRTPAGD
jgi:SAM-dependent methyltransferase